MFNWFKSKPKEKAKVKEKQELTSEEKLSVKKEVAECQAALTTIDQSNTDELAKAYEKLGVLQAKVESDEAIVSLEKSLAYKQSIGDGYKCLMSLYNQKRSAAAHSGDDAGIDKWMGKMDELRQIARNNTIGSN